MARLAAIGKALYYPTQPRIVSRIANLGLGLRGGVLLDPCAGEGAAAEIARAWEMTPWGVELDGGRAATAHAAFSALGGQCFHGSIYQAQVTGGCDVLFGNWPYDDVWTAEREGGAEDDVDVDWDRRQELRFLRLAARWLRPGGTCIQVIPEKVAVSDPFRALMAHYFESYLCLRYPEPEYDEFKQVVLVTRKSVEPRYVRSWYSPEVREWSVDGPEILAARSWHDCNAEALQPTARESKPGVKSELFELRLRALDPAVVMPALPTTTPGAGAWGRVLDMATPVAAATERPLRPLRDGHLAMLLAAGCLDGTEVVEESGARVLVKGSSAKVVRTREDAEAAKVYETERFASRLSTLNLETGELHELSLDESPEEVQAWLTRHGHALAEAVRRRFPPRVTDLEVESTPLPVRAPGVLPGETTPRFLFPQRAGAVATLRWWDDQKAAAISGEMTCGKTAMSIAAAVARGGKFVVFCPTHLVEKWQREIRAMCDPAVGVMSAKKLADVDRFFATRGLRFLVIGKEAAKLGARWRPAYAVKRSRRSVVRWQEITRKVKPWWSSVEIDEVDRVQVETTETVSVLCCPRCGAEIRDKDSAITEAQMASDKRTCLAKVERGDGTMVPCGERLWQSAPISDKGTKRWPIATYLAHRYCRQYGLIIDEAHVGKGADTDVAQSIQKLKVAATRTLDMTGTWYGGRASSLFYLLYRISPEFRRVYAYNECKRFVDTFGLYERSYDASSRSTGRYGYRRGGGGTARIREIPGAHPGMIRLLLPFTTFIRVSDLGYALPDFSEHVVMLDPDERVASAAENMVAALRPLLRTKPRILGAYLMTGLGWPDRPEVGEAIVDPEDSSELVRLPELVNASMAKDDWLVEQCQSSRESGRKVMVFLTQTEKRDAYPRLAARLSAAGLRPAVLRATVSADKREAWLREHEPSFDVLFTQPQLVETGLDILWAHDLVFYQTHFSVSTVRQASRRSLRLGQLKNIRVFHLAYKRTFQAPALHLVAKKVRAAELLDGAEHGGFVEQGDAGGADLFMDIAKAAVAGTYA